MRVLIIDDHPVFREGVRALLETQAGIDVVGTIGEGQGAVDVVREEQADIVLLDVGLTDVPGQDVCRQLHEALPTVRVLMLTANDSDETIRTSLAAGADGYVLKTEDPMRLIDHIWAVSKGETVLAGPVAQKVVRQLLDSPPVSDSRSAEDLLVSLTDRERQVFFLAAEGRRNSDIAAQLCLSEETIKTHLRNIYSKLELANKAELRLFAAQAHLSPPLGS